MTKTIRKIPHRQGWQQQLKFLSAVDLYVYGPKSETKQETVKGQITARSGRLPHVRYTAAVETPIKRTHLARVATVVEFGPENIASVYVPQSAKKK